MTQMTKKRQNRIIGWLTVWTVIVLGLMSWPSLYAAAQDPDPLPTATSDTPPDSQATASPTAGVPVGPTPSGPTATPEGRVVNFRAESDEIDLGECVLFSWVVRGDVAWVEFNEVDDDEDPLLVDDQGDRQECPDNDTDYELIVTWLDGSKSRDGIEIEVNGSGSSSGGGGSGGGGGGGAAPTPGAFVVVTPIAYADVRGEVTPIPGFMNIPDSASLPPDNAILASIVQLPETGLSKAGSAPADQIYSPYPKQVGEARIDAAEIARSGVSPARSSGLAALILLLSSGLVVLAKYSR